MMLHKKKDCVPVPTDRCCGCMACVNACPAACMTVEWNDQGFPHPVIARNQCLKCGKCQQVCPVAFPLPSRYPDEAFALRIKDHSLWEASSSGGAFTILANRVLAQGGVVFGAAFAEGHSVVLQYVEDSAHLDQLRRSKYVYSSPGAAYHECRRFLDEGRQVLFCALPCQIAALKRITPLKLQEKLITADMICHGVPSPRVFHDYLAETAARNGISPDKITDINFRRKHDLDRTPFSFSCMAGEHEIIEPLAKNHYLLGFVNNLYLNEACYHCSQTRFRSGSDYTLADFWGIRELFPEISPAERWSLLLVFQDPLSITNEKSDADFELLRVKVSDALKNNRGWKNPPVEHPRRKAFWAAYTEGGVSHNIENNLPYPKMFQIQRKCSGIIGRIIERLHLEGDNK